MKEAKELDSTYTVNIVFNALLCFTAIMLNSVTIHAIRNNSSVPKPLRTLLLNLAVSDLSVGLLVHPLYIASLFMNLNQNTENGTVFNDTKMAFRLIANLLCYASFFGVMALTADRFLAIHLHLRYQELVTHKRVVAVVTTMMVFSAFLSSFQVWISVETVKLKTYIIIEIVCLAIIAILYYKIYLTVRRHRNEMQSLQVQQEEQYGELTSMSVARRVKLAVGTFYVYLVFMVCYLPRICLEIVIIISGHRTTTTDLLRPYSWAMVLLNSSLNPLIYCWKMRHIRHSVINILQNVFHRYN